MAQPQIAPYGSWGSPVTSDLIVRGTVRLAEIELDGEDIYWIERRPSEGGRHVVVRHTPDGQKLDVTPLPFNARTRVHEYGGGGYAVADGVVYFSNDADQRLYRQAPGAPPSPLTPSANLRYADGVVDARRQRLICVREDHTVPGAEAANTLVAVDLAQGGPGIVLAEGNDFYSSPRLSPDGSRLAWLAWDYPNMPWDGCELWVAGFQGDGSLAGGQCVAGGKRESIFQPEWSPDGVLHFASDRSGWWNLYRWRGGEVEPLYAMEAEFGQPQWTFGRSLYGFEAPSRIVCAYVQQGAWCLARLDTARHHLEPIPTPYTDIHQVRVRPGRALFIAGSPTQAPAVVALDLDTEKAEVLATSGEPVLSPEYLSLPRAIEYPTGHGLTAHAFYYPPRNPGYAPPPGERPPLLVMSHGGPTGATTATLDLGTQFWTSRGIAVLDVNYGGSTGYGRAYRERLNGQWGIVDVDDCVNGALHLARQGEVDPERLVITGGSAGGYTTLCALTFRDVFRAGASYYGIGDLETMVRDTHKFESRYLFTLIGPYPERRDLYHDRSPINFTGELSCPVIFFQGLEDKVVPPSQAEEMVQALRARKLPVAYLTFAGEQHGFRRAENMRRSLEAELYFYARVLGFELADPVEPVGIENL